MVADAMCSEFMSLNVCVSDLGAVGGHQAHKTQKPPSLVDTNEGCGKTVVIQGLTSKPELNGAIGVSTSKEKGRI